jgi:hypothetical protein
MPIYRIGKKSPRGSEIWQRTDLDITRTYGNTSLPGNGSLYTIWTMPFDCQKVFDLNPVRDLFRNIKNIYSGVIVLKTLLPIAILAACLIGCSSTSTSPTLATAPSATAGAQGANAVTQPTSIPPNPNADTVGAFPQTDPQIAPAGITGDAKRGAALFTQKGIECDGCHDVTHNYPGGDFGPNQANVASIAASVLKNPDYKGKAKTVDQYLRESILVPNIYLVPGDDYKEKDGSSAMKQDFAQKLTPQQVEDLIAYLMSLTPEK